jgi:sporulation protein YlmC with PRC-barrel domain
MAMVAVSLIGGVVAAQDPSRTPPATTADPSSKMHVYRANDIVGMHVKNPTGQELGKVEDLVIDMSMGKVRYAAVSFGGFLGVGDKLFAVPFQAFQIKHDAGDNKRHLVLNVDKATLEGAKGFDKKSWPDFGNPRWGTENDKFFLDSTATKPTTERR